MIQGIKRQLIGILIFRVVAATYMVYCARSEGMISRKKLSLNFANCTISNALSKNSRQCDINSEAALSVNCIKHQGNRNDSCS